MKNLLKLTLLFVVIISCTQKKKTETEINSKNTSGFFIDTIYHKKGKIYEIQYHNGNSIDSIKKYNSRNNKLLGKGIVVDNYIKYFRIDGTKQYEGYLKKGKLNGVVYYYSSNGSFVGSNVFKDGIKNGATILLNENAMVLKKLASYKEGTVKDGILLDFYENGTVKYIGESDFDKEYSQSAEFHENGVLKTITPLKNKSAHGWSLYFDIKGVLVKKVLYNNGNLVKEIKVQNED